MTKSLLCCALLLASSPLAAQQATPPASAEDEAGFESIFDGKTLDGWDGDKTYWRAEDGVLVGEVTPETLLKQNTFIIWQGGKPADFELKLDYRIAAAGNSGIQYRSEPVEGIPHALRGYQADIDGANKYTGLNYEERARAFLAPRGEIGRIDADGKSRKVGAIGDAEALAKLIKSEDWNSYHLIIRGNVLIHMINGQVMSIAVDDDAANRKFEGLLGMQVHVGPPMKVEFRNIRLKQLKPAMAPK